MGNKPKLPLILLTLLSISLFAASSILSSDGLETRDPEREFQQCQQKCLQQPQSQQQQCQQRCSEQYKEQQQEGCVQGENPCQPQRPGCQGACGSQCGQQQQPGHGCSGRQPGEEQQGRPGGQGGEQRPGESRPGGREPEEEFQRCRQQCRRGQEQQQQCEERCERHFEEQRPGGQGQETRPGGQGQETHPGGQGEQQPWEPQEDFQRCMQQCRRLPLGREQEQRCEERCERHFEEQQGRPGGQEEQTRPGGQGEQQPWEPQEDFQSCMQQCQRLPLGREQQQRCKERCERHFEEQQGRPGGQGGETRPGGQGEQTRPGGQAEQQPWEPQEEFQSCMQQCQRLPLGREQQQRCEERCERHFEEQQERPGGQGGETRPGGQGEQTHPGGQGEQQPWEPQEEFQSCMQQCQRLPLGREQQRRCEEHCERHFEEQQGRPETRPGGQGEQTRPGGQGEQQPWQPQEEFQRCKQQCRRLPLGREQQQRCEERCERHFEEQQGRPIGQGGETRPGGQGEQQPWEPQEEFQSCMQQCQRLPLGREQQRRCEEHCERHFEEQQGRPETRPGGQGEQTRPGGQGEQQPWQPQEEFQRCKQQCRRLPLGREQQQRCEERCERHFEEQQGRPIGQGGETRPGGQGEQQPWEPQEEFQSCMQQCQRLPLGREQQRRCEEHCERHFEEQQGRPETRPGGQGEQTHPGGQGEQQPWQPQEEFQRCKQQCRRLSLGREQQQRCEERCDRHFEEQQGRPAGQEGEKQPWEPQPGVSGPQEEFQRCRQQCRRLALGREQKQRCEERCERHFEEQQGRPGGQGGETRPGEQGQQRPWVPQEELQKCRQQCRRLSLGRDQQQSCEERCQRQFEEEHEQVRPGGGSDRPQGWEEENPYLFPSHRFTGRISSPNGNIRVLERFTSRSNLLEGIDNYRLALFEANPNAFMLPNHRDADSIGVVLRGQGTFTLIQDNNKETFNVKEGDIFRIQAGTTVHAVNRDNNQKLDVLELTAPVNTPGQFEEFFAPGGRNPESYFNVFSDDIMQAAFNTPRDQLRRMFQGQNQGPFVPASPEQIRAMSRQTSSEHGPWPFHREPQCTYNLFNQRPCESNQYGRLYEVFPEEFKPIQDMDVAVSFANITQGAMFGPFYNSKSTKIAMVVNGNGYFEMACPHVSQQGRTQPGRSTTYRKVSARVGTGDVFVVPAGHPIVTVASNEQNLQVVCFELCAQNNQRYPLAGNNNILKQLEREAKELSFNVPARQVDEIFNNQRGSWFFPGPQQRQGGGRAAA